MSTVTNEKLYGELYSAAKEACEKRKSSPEWQLEWERRWELLKQDIQSLIGPMSHDQLAASGYVAWNNHSSVDILDDMIWELFAEKVKNEGLSKAAVRENGRVELIEVKSSKV